jgi:hypothetical protein
VAVQVKSHNHSAGSATRGGRGSELRDGGSASGMAGAVRNGNERHMQEGNPIFWVSRPMRVPLPNSGVSG